MTEHGGDVKENRLIELDADILSILLKDNTTNKNLIWATSNYAHKGAAYASEREIQIGLIADAKESVIKPRMEKTKVEQQDRARSKGEVFTPAWVCNLQNNLIDEQWFGTPNLFNHQTDQGWITNHNKIQFPKSAQKNWQHYVKSPRLEVSCGEAPYMTSRYDSVTGTYIEVVDRIGFLDRKLRVIGEHIDTQRDWITWAYRAVRASYGYDWQGDNILLARENVLYTVIEFFKDKFAVPLPYDALKKFAKIIAWNIWQMDALKCVVPNSCHKERPPQDSFFPSDSKDDEVCLGCKGNDILLHRGTYCNIMDWKTQKAVRFVNLLDRKEDMA